MHAYTDAVKDRVGQQIVHIWVEGDMALSGDGLRRWICYSIYEMSLNLDEEGSMRCLPLGS